MKTLFKLLLTLLAKSWRIKTDFVLPQSPSVIAFWHSGMLPVWYVFRLQKPFAVVSKSKDGQLLSDLLESWHFQLIRGSSSKGGKQVLNSMIAELDSNSILITPDGPRGPKQVFKPGIFIASQRTQRPIYFINVLIKHKFTFKKAWDNFELPLPFAKIYLHLSEPFIVPAELDKDLLNDYISRLEL